MKSTFLDPNKFKRYSLFVDEKLAKINERNSIILKESTINQWFIVLAFTFWFYFHLTTF